MLVMDEEEKLKRLIAMLEVAGRDTVTAQDIAELVEVILSALVKVKDDADAAIAEARNSGSKETGALDAATKAVHKETSEKLREYKRLIDKLIAWKDQYESGSTEDDAAEALELAKQNETDIERIRDLIRDLERKPGPRGKTGLAPDHRWEDTTLFFQYPDGEWDDGVDLKGEPGAVVHSGGYDPGAGMGGVRRIRAGANITVTGDPSEPIISSTGGGSGGTVTTEIPPEAVDGARVNFSASAAPAWVVSDSGVYFDGAGYSYAGGTVTMDVAPSQWIQLVIVTSAAVTVATPPEVPDGVITVYTVASRPKWVVSDAGTYFEGFGYSYSTGQITFDTAPSQWVRVIL